MSPRRPIDEPALSEADADVARRDPALPGLATLLSPPALLERLRRAYPDADLRAAEPTYVRYKRGTSCIAGFRLDVGGAPVYAYARAHARNDIEKLSKFAGTPGADTPLGTSTVDLSDCSTVVSLFPNDAALPSLRLLADPVQLSALLAKVLPEAVTGAGWGHGGAGEAARITPLAYKPERRFVGQLAVAGRPVAVLKFYTDAGYAVAQRNAKMVKSRGLFRVPRRLGRSERHGLVALGWLPGRPLGEALADTATEPDWSAIARLGAGLAAFASKGSARFRHRPRGGAGVATVIEVARVVGGLWPPLAARAANLAERVARHLADNTRRDRPIHGDFYAKQVLLDDDALGVVDWDEAGLGEPASDVGNFIAHLERHALAGRFPRDRVGPAGDALRTGFEAAAGRSIAERVRVHTAAQLLQMATHPFRGREPDWPAGTAAILDRVEELLFDRAASARGAVAEGPPPPSPVAHAARPAVAVSDAFGVAADHAIPFGRAALDPAVVQEPLRRALAAAGLPEGLELRAIRVIRHKPGRRFLAEYELDGARIPSDGSPLTVIGKVRAKGADERTDELTRALWSADFRRDSADGISVPRPLGVVPELGMTLQLKAPGEPAGRLLARGGAAGVELAARLADVAHKLHRASMPVVRTHTRADELRILHERLGRVAAEHPEWDGSIRQLLAACDDLLESFPPLPLAGIHRDFYPDQVLIEGARLHVLDLDLYSLGEPPLDVGNCMAHVTEQALRTCGDADAWVDQERAIEDRFLAADPNASRAAVRAYAAVSLARHVQISTLFPDRRHLTRHLLELSRHRVDAVTQC